MKRNNDSEIIETFANNEYISLLSNDKDNVSRNVQYTDELLREDNRIFDYETYAKEIHSPVEIKLGESLNLSEMPRCLDMPIRLAGEEEYRLPTNWSNLQNTLEKLINIEHYHNKNWKDYHTYITVDSKPVSVGEQQRHGGLHVDGFQGERIIEKTKITRNYVATTNGGTQFWNQKFIVADPQKFNVFQGFDLQVDGKPFVAKPDTFYFMDAYTVHESGYAEFNGERIFVRLTYDLKKFDRLGNTHNPNLHYDWKMIKRNAQEIVESPRLTDIIDSPYFPNR